MPRIFTGVHRVYGELTILFEGVGGAYLFLPPPRGTGLRRGDRGAWLKPPAPGKDSRACHYALIVAGYVVQTTCLIRRYPAQNRGESPSKQGTNGRNNSVKRAAAGKKLLNFAFILPCFRAVLAGFSISFPRQPIRNIRINTGTSTIPTISTNLVYIAVWLLLYRSCVCYFLSLHTISLTFFPILPIILLTITS